MRKLAVFLCFLMLADVRCAQAQKKGFAPYTKDGLRLVYAGAKRPHVVPKDEYHAEFPCFRDEKFFGAGRIVFWDGEHKLANLKRGVWEACADPESSARINTLVQKRKELLRKAIEELGKIFVTRDEFASFLARRRIVEEARIINVRIRVFKKRDVITPENPKRVPIDTFMVSVELGPKKWFGWAAREIAWKISTRDSTKRATYVARIVDAI